MREKKKSRTVVQKGFFLPKMRRNIEKRDRKTEGERQKMLLQFQIETQKSEAAAAKVRIFNNLLDYSILLDILGAAAAAAAAALVYSRKRAKKRDPVGKKGF